MSEQSGQKRRLLSRANAAVVIAATLGLAVVANAVSSQVFTRFDLTENKIYTLSDASKVAVQKLDEPVEVRAFISPEMPPPFHNLSQQLQDLLSEYAAASNGTLTFQIINPDDDPETEEAARGFGIEKVAMGQQTEKEISLRAVYKGIAFVKGDKTEVIRDLQTTGRPEQDNFEYEFTKAILNLTSSEGRKVGFLAGFGGPGGSPQFVSSVSPVFEQLYGNLIKPTSVDLSQEATIPDDVHALVILNLEQPVSDKARFAIDQFIQRGGSVGWFQSASVVDMELQSQLAQLGGRGQMPETRKASNTNLADLFGHYGIELRQDVVFDRERSLAFGMVMTPQGLAQISHPATFSITDIDATLPFTRNLGTVALPAPSSLVVTAAAREQKDLEIFEIFKTAPSAVRRPETPKSIGYDAFAQRTPDEEKGPFLLGAALQGPIASYYRDKPLPEGVTEDQLIKESQPARVLIVGNGEFYQPVQQAGYDERLAGLGAQFFLSSIEWLVQDSELSQIRGKNMPTLIGEVDKPTQRTIQFVNIACVPAVFAGVGVLMMSRRRRRKETLRL